MKRILKRMNFKSSFRMSEFIRINRIDEKDIYGVVCHGNDITLHYYANTKEETDDELRQTR